jgi:uncharacterized protein with FMN-binding domain
MLLTQLARPAAVHAAVPSPALSAMTASRSALNADGVSTATITVQLKDANGANLTAGGDTVQLDMSTTAYLTRSPVTDHGDGTYSASVQTQNGPPGTTVISARVNGMGIISSVQISTNFAGSPSSWVPAVSPQHVAADGASTATITFVLQDANHTEITRGGYAVTMQTTLGTLGPVVDRGDGTYSTTIRSATDGWAKLTAMAGGWPVMAEPPSGPDVLVAFGNAGPNPIPSAAMSSVSAARIRLTAIPTPANKTTITVRLRNAAGEALVASLYTPSLLKSSPGNWQVGSLSPLTNNHDGTYTATFTADTATGIARIEARVNGQSIGTVEITQLITGVATSWVPTVTPQQVIADGTSTATITWELRDVMGETITTGGCGGTLTTSIGTPSPMTDNQDATCSVTIRSNRAGEATVSLSVNGTSMGTATVTFFGPAISAAPSRAPDQAGWYRSPVTVSFPCAAAVSCTGPITVSADGAGQQITGSAVNSVGQGASVQVAVNVDLTPPVTTMTAPSNPAYAFSLSATDALSGVQATWFRVDNGVAVNGRDVPAYAARDHTVEYWSVDNAGNEEAHHSYTHASDGTPPVITGAAGSAPNAGGWYNRPVTVSFRCTDAESGVAQCQAPVTLATEGAGQKATGNARDREGNAATTTVSGINIDLTPPVASGVTAPALTNSRTVTLGWDARDGLSGVAGGRLYFSGDDGRNWTEAGALSPGQPAGFVAPAAGRFGLWVAAEDKAGNRSASPQPGSRPMAAVTIDTVPPAGTVRTDPYTNTDVAILFLKATDANGVADMRFSTGHDRWTDWESFQAAKNVQLSGEGSRTILAQFRDRAGNVSAPVRADVVRDVSPPTGTVQIGNGSGYAPSVETTLTLHAEDDRSGVAAMRFAPGYDWTPWEPYDTQRPIVLSETGTVRVQFRDGAGNVLGPVMAQAIVDPTVINGTGVVTGFAADERAAQVQLTLTATPATSGPMMRFSLDGSNWTPWEPFAATKSLSVPGAAQEALYVQYRSRAGKESDPLRVPFRMAYRTTGDLTAYSFGLTEAGKGVGTYVYDPELMCLVRVATAYTAGTGTGNSAVAQNWSGFWLNLPEPSVQFADVASSPFRRDIEALAQMRLLSGYAGGVFRPGRPLTRAEAVAMLVVAGNVRPGTGASGLRDVTGHWAEPYIRRAWQAGVISGYADGTFRPDKPMTRAEFIQLLVKVFGLRRQPDAVAAGIASPSGRFRPDSPITREEAAGFLYPAVQRMHRELLSRRP